MFFSMDSLQLGTREVTPGKTWTGTTNTLHILCGDTVHNGLVLLAQPVKLKAGGAYNDSNCLLQEDKEIQSIKCINSQQASGFQDLLLGAWNLCNFPLFSNMYVFQRKLHFLNAPFLPYVERNSRGMKYKKQWKSPTGHIKLNSLTFGCSGLFIKQLKFWISTQDLGPNRGFQ